MLNGNHNRNNKADVRCFRAQFILLQRKWKDKSLDNILHNMHSFEDHKQNEWDLCWNYCAKMCKVVSTLCQKLTLNLKISFIKLSLAPITLFDQNYLVCQHSLNIREYFFILLIQFLRIRYKFINFPDSYWVLMWKNFRSTTILWYFIQNLTIGKKPISYFRAWTLFWFVFVANKKPIYANSFSVWK